MKIEVDPTDALVVSIELRHQAEKLRALADKKAKNGDEEDLSAEIFLENAKRYERVAIALRCGGY